MGQKRKIEEFIERKKEVGEKDGGALPTES